MAASRGTPHPTTPLTDDGPLVGLALAAGQGGGGGRAKLEEEEEDEDGGGQQRGAAGTEPHRPPRTSEPTARSRWGARLLTAAAPPLAPCAAGHAGKCSPGGGAGLRAEARGGNGGGRGPGAGFGPQGLTWPGRGVYIAK